MLIGELINQTNKKLRNEQKKVLSLGLNFIFANEQTPEDLARLEKDVYQWERKINPVIHHAAENRNNFGKDNHKGWLEKEIQSSWEPGPQNWEWSEELQELKRSIILKTGIRKTNRNKRTPETIMQVVNQLKRMRDIHILPANKGRNTTIWSQEDYDKEAYRQLEDATTYKNSTKKNTKGL